MNSVAAVGQWRARAILDDPVTARVLHAVWSGDPLVCAPAPPGSGKSRLIALLAATLVERAGLRVGFAAQTREQASELARRLGAYTERAVLGWAASGAAPDLAGAKVRIARGSTVRFPDTAGGVVVATTAKWLSSSPDLLGCDVMLIDEAWQATYADVGALGAFAAQVALVGDPGQVAPVVTGSTARWEGSPRGPHLSSPDALLSVHRDVATTVRLRHTWRLGPDTTALIQPAFYPRLPFTSKRPPEHIESSTGTALPEIQTVKVPTQAGPTDPTLLATVAQTVRDLLTTSLHTAESQRPLTEADVIVVLPHVAQTAAVRALLSDLPEVLVGTANSVQGMERHAAVIAHPLAGYRDPTTFGTDAGRACVMLTRHRAHLSVIADTATGDVLTDADPTDPGIATHRNLWARL